MIQVLVLAVLAAIPFCIVLGTKFGSLNSAGEAFALGIAAFISIVAVLASIQSSTTTLSVGSRHIEVNGRLRRSQVFEKAEIDAIFDSRLRTYIRLKSGRIVRLPDFLEHRAELFVLLRA